MKKLLKRWLIFSCRTIQLLCFSYKSVTYRGITNEKKQKCGHMPNLINTEFKGTIQFLCGANAYDFTI